MIAQVVSFKCILKNKLGHLISTTINRDVITSIQTPDGPFLAGLIEGLQDLRVGEKRRIAVAAEQAYGFYDPKKILQLPKEKIVSHSSADKTEDTLLISHQGIHQKYRIIEIQEDTVTLDGNHPLAGQDLVFEIEAIDVRAATPEEIFDSSLVDSKEVFH